MNTRFSIQWHVEEENRAQFRHSRSHYGANVTISGQGREASYPDLTLFFPNIERARMITAAFNGELCDILERAFALADDIGDGAPDAPAIAHRALQLASDIGKLLPAPAAPEKVKERRHDPHPNPPPLRLLPSALPTDDANACGNE